MEKNKTIYLSGKIAGLPWNEVRSNFDLATTQVYLHQGYVTVVDPSQLPKTQNSWGHYLLRDLQILQDCDAIAMLPNWKDSKSARVERAFAEGLGLEIIEL